MSINIIAAYNQNSVIGKDGQIPWHLLDDLQHFKEVTKGHPVIMGRKTHESIGQLLVGRRNIIVTRQDVYHPVDVSDVVFVVSSLDEAIDAAQKEDEEIFIIGGEEIYRQAIPLADRMYLTYVFSDSQQGDTYFPDFELSDWHASYLGVTETCNFKLYERKK